MQKRKHLGSKANRTDMKEKSDQNTEGKNFTVRLEKNQFMSTVIFKSDKVYFLKPKSWQL